MIYFKIIFLYTFMLLFTIINLNNYNMGMFISLYVHFSSASEAFVVGGLTSIALWGILALFNKRKNEPSENDTELNCHNKASDANDTFTNSSNNIVDDVYKVNTSTETIKTKDRVSSIENTEKVQTPKIKAFNRMSAEALMKSQNSEIQFIENPNNGKIFFVCGDIKGYVSPLVVEKMDTVTVADLQYAEVSIDNKPAVPCLMMVDRKVRKVQRTITLGSQVNADKSVMKRKLINAFEENIEEVKEKIDNTIFGDMILTSTIANTYQSLKEQEALKLICEAQNIDFIELLDEAYEEIRNRFNNDLP